MIFVDTGYWIALLDKSDTLHANALEFAHRLKTDRIYTSEMVLAEVLNHFSNAGPTARGAAIQLTRKLQKAS